MKIGCQTIIFGRCIHDLDYVLANIAHLGYTGVEFFQHPDHISVYDPISSTFRKATIEDIVMRLQKYRLTFLGLTGGTIEQRIAFCLGSDPNKREALDLSVENCRPLYLYTQDLDPETLQQAASHGFALAFHPHAFTKYERVEKAKADFDPQNTHLFWLPDTAHMTVVGEDPIATLQSLPVKKVIAVHLKDYDPAYGRSYYRYAKGFVCLGEGRVPLKNAIATMENRGFEGWYVVEQDFSHSNPLVALQKSAAWLIDQGYMSPSSGTLTLEAIPSNKRDIVVPARLEKTLYDFTRDLHRAGESPLQQCYHDTARAIYDWLQAAHVTLWSCSPSRDDVCLLASYPPELQTEDLPWKVNINRSPLGKARFPMNATVMDIASLEEGDPATLFSYRSVALKTAAQSAIAMAIPNRYNPNATRLLIGVLQKETHPCSYSDIVELISDDIGCAVNAALDDACAVAAGNVSLIADQKGALNDFLSKLGPLIKQELECEALTIFLKNRTGDRLESRWGPWLEWQEGLPENEKCYRKEETKHPTVQCWQECRTILMASAVNEVFGGDHKQAKSTEQVPAGSELHDDVLVVPLVAASMKPDGTLLFSVIGVVRCRNKQKITLTNGALQHPYFTHDDAAILSTICQSSVPHIDTLMRDEGLAKTISNMTHELNMPVNTLQAAVDRVQTLIAQGRYSALSDLAEDMLSWTGLMGRIIDMADLFGKRDRLLEPECERIGLFGDVIAPLKPVMSKLLADRGFDVNKITYGKIESIPLLYLDRNQFQMVFFNLFSNAIKYSFNDPSQFRIEITAEHRNGEYQIRFQNWGPGILPEYIDAVFDIGIRGPTAVNQLVKGMGLGLWVVRRVVEAHEGRVAVTSASDPTTITIFLPEARRASPPRLKRN